jgi:putative ABC transport system permease protein
MFWIALKMLVANRGKYLMMIGGVAFASLLICQQTAIFCGVMALTYSQIRDVREAEIWVMDPNVMFVDDVKPISDDALHRVRGVKGVEWAVPFFKSTVRGRLEDGTYQQMVLLGLDDATLVGAPQVLLMGNLADLQQPDAFLMDKTGYQLLWPDEPFQLGKVLELNDHRAVLVGICEASRTFQTFPVVYTRYSQAITYIAPERRMLPFVLAKAQPGVDPRELCQRIAEATGLKAETREQFMWTTVKYYLSNTGIPINFGLTILLGYMVGTLVAGQTFYLFTIENLPHFAMLKAMGTSNRRIMRMLLLQAFAVGVIGYGLGLGPSSFCARYVTAHSVKLAFYMPWPVLIVTAVSMVMIVVTFSLFSVRRVLVEEPAIVFRG